MSRFLAAAALSGAMMFTGVSIAGDPPKTDAGKGATRLTSAPSYVPMPPLTSATPLGRGIGGMITVEFGFDIPDARQRARAQAMRPRLQDALRSAVSAYAMSHIRPGAAPDPTQLCVMAQGSIDRAMGAPGVKVLITNVMITDRR
jgi:flagellar basal body-associated protein FliL